MMHAISFEATNVVPVSVAGRMDVVCFIGYAAQNPDRKIPESLLDWWRQQGWLSVEKTDDINLLYELPVPVESWEEYKTCFTTTRNDHRAQVQSHPLVDPVLLAETDRELHVLIDHHQQGATDSAHTVVLVPDIDAEKISVMALVDQINSQLTGARASIQTRGSDTHLVIQRLNDVNAGELTIFANQSLGFFEPQQDDVFALSNPLSTAVQTFFQQGGRKCYVISRGSPLPMLATEHQKIRHLLVLLFGDSTRDDLMGDAIFNNSHLLVAALPAIETLVSPDAHTSSLAMLQTLPDVTYLSLPDLVDLLGHYDLVDPGAPKPQAPEIFVECSEQPAALPRYYLQAYRAATFTREDYEAWKLLVWRILEFLTLYVPTIQFVTSLPLPDVHTRRRFENFVTEEVLDYPEDDGIYYRRLQLAFPWIRTPDSQDLPQQLLAPEGALLGILARHALVRGAHRSVAGSLHDAAYDVYPRDLDPLAAKSEIDIPFMERISFFDFEPAGITLLSDATAENSLYDRFAVIRRIMIMVQRAAQTIGMNHVFSSSGPALWRTIENSLSSLLLRIYQEHGLRGKTADEAFSVTCDRSTMTQSDLDNGRLVANIVFRPAVPVEKITVALAVQSDGSIDLRSH